MGNFHSHNRNVDSILEKSVPNTCTLRIDGTPTRVVIISDTHNDHRSFERIPDGDILIHAGDWTCYGKREHATDFNDWLGTLPHKIKIVVNGNHESNTMWKAETGSILSNAIFLKDEVCRIDSLGNIFLGNDSSCESNDLLTIYGTNFYWPMKYGEENPYFNTIPEDVQILVCHNPALGYVDGGSGCPSMRHVCESLMQREEARRLRLVISGHIHKAYGMTRGEGVCKGVTFVNGSNVSSSRKIENPPIVIDM